MSTAAVDRQTHITVRRYVGARCVKTRQQPTLPQQRAQKRRERLRSAVITGAVLLIAACSAAYLITNPLHH